MNYSLQGLSDAVAAAAAAAAADATAPPLTPFPP